MRHKFAGPTQAELEQSRQKLKAKAAKELVESVQRRHPEWKDAQVKAYIDGRG